MASITLTAANIRPLDGAVVRRGTAGATLTPGAAVYLDGANGWKLGDADVAASALCRGIVVSDGFGSTSFASGAAVDIVRHGPIAGFTSMTAGGNVFVSNTPGELDQTATTTSGDFVVAIGYADSASVIFVNPQAHVPVVLP